MLDYTFSQLKFAYPKFYHLDDFLYKFFSYPSRGPMKPFWAHRDGESWCISPDDFDKFNHDENTREAIEVARHGSKKDRCEFISAAMALTWLTLEPWKHADTVNHAIQILEGNIGHWVSDLPKGFEEHCILLTRQGRFATYFGDVSAHNRSIRERFERESRGRHPGDFKQIWDSMSSAGSYTSPGEEVLHRTLSNLRLNMKEKKPRY